MQLISLIKLKYGSIRNCASAAGIPYMTLYDICRGKTSIYDCSCKTAMLLAASLDMSVDELLDDGDMRFFRDSLHNELKANGIPSFLVNKLVSKDVQKFWHLKKYAKALYLLAMIDSLCEELSVPLAEDYEEYRSFKLEKPLVFGHSSNHPPLDTFLKYNIYEGELFDAV